MNQYLELLKAIKKNGTTKSPARAGLPSTVSVFGYQFRIALKDGFPLLTTKKVDFKNIVTELLWFLQGNTNIKFLIDHGCNIWNEDAYNYYLKQPIPYHYELEDFVQQIKIGELDCLPDYKLGDCGYLYGKNWRAWPGEKGEIDQVKNLISGLQRNPLGRNHILTSWNPAHLDDMAVNACHALVQFNCRPLSLYERFQKFIKNVTDNTQYHFSETMKSESYLDQYNVPKYILDCQMYQRSADVFLGVPYNIASYALLTEILCKMCNMIPGEFIHTFGDVHIYSDHMEQVNEQLKRTPTELPKLEIKECPITGFDLDYLSIGQFKLENYTAQPAIRAKLSTGLR